MSQTSEVPLQTVIFHTVMLVGEPIDGASTSNSTKSMINGVTETDAPAPSGAPPWSWTPGHRSLSVYPNAAKIRPENPLAFFSDRN